MMVRNGVPNSRGDELGECKYEIVKNENIPPHDTIVKVIPLKVGQAIKLKEALEKGINANCEQINIVLYSEDGRISVKRG